MEKQTRERIARWIDRKRLSFPGMGIWLLGGEPGVQLPEEYDDALLRVLIVRLSPYRSVASSISHGVLGQLASQVPAVYVDYSYMPPACEACEMERSSIPPLFGTTSKRPFQDFDLLAVSHSVAQELINLPWLLSRSGVPFPTCQRLDDESVPLLIMGGANGGSAFIACPPSEYRLSLVDGLYFGEAEPYWPMLLDILKERKGCSKRERLSIAMSLVPSFHAPAAAPASPRQRACTKDIDSAFNRSAMPLSYMDEDSGTGRITVDAGCPSLCAFCKEAWESRPYRIRALSAVLDDIRCSKALQGLEGIDLFSFNLGSHKDAEALLRESQKLVHRVSMKSQRFDGILAHPEILEIEQAMGKNSFTFGLEGISDRIRRYLAKGVETGDILEALRRVAMGHVRQIKLFIILTGFEDHRDWTEFDDLLCHVASMAGGGRKIPIVLSHTPLICMPHTPMQYAPFPDRKAMAEGMKRLSDTAGRYRMQVRESISYDEALMAQMLLWGGGEQTEALISLCELGLYYQEVPGRLAAHFEKQCSDEWKAMIRAEKGPEASFPWDILMTPEEKRKLHHVYSHIREELQSHKVIRPFRTAPSMIRSGRLPEREQSAGVWFRLETEEKYAGLPSRHLQTDLARQLMMADRSLIDAYSHRGAVAAAEESFWGTRLVELYFTRHVHKELEEVMKGGLSGRTWSLKGFRQELHAPTPEGVLLVMEGPRDHAEQEARFYSSLLASLGLRHRISRTGDFKALHVSPSLSGKGGCHFVICDYRTGRLTVSLSLRGDYRRILSHRMMKEMMEKDGRMFRALSLWSRGGACEKCGSKVLVDIFDGEALRGEGSFSLCSELCFC